MFPNRGYSRSVGVGGGEKGKDEVGVADCGLMSSTQVNAVAHLIEGG
jgi:hypothetical protein